MKTRKFDLFFVVWILLGGLIYMLVSSVTVQRVEISAEPQEIDCVISHNPTGYGPSDAYTP